MASGIKHFRPLGDRMLVRRYEKPDKIGSIIVPDPYRADMSGTLWEFVRGTPTYLQSSKEGYADVLGAELEEGDIIQTGPMAGVYIGDGYFMISAKQVEVVHPWVSASEGDDGE